MSAPHYVFVMFMQLPLHLFHGWTDCTIYYEPCICDAFIHFLQPLGGWTDFIIYYIEPCIRHAFIHFIATF